MLPGTYDLNLYRGDTTRLQFTLWQDQAKTLPVDLGGAVAAAQVRSRPDDAAVLVQLVCEIVLPNVINVTVPTLGAAALRPQGAWDLQLTWANGDIQTVLAGAAYAAADVTRS